MGTRARSPAPMPSPMTPPAFSPIRPTSPALSPQTATTIQFPPLRSPSPLGQFLPMSPQAQQSPPDAESRKLTGTVNPNNSPTTYWFEYGTADCSSNPCTSSPASQDASAGSGGEPSPVERIINALDPGTTYHFRLVARNEEGTTEGADLTFRTAAPPPDSGDEGLPDGRAYELVTPPANKNGADVTAMSERTRVAADGNAVTYASLTAYGDVIGTGIATDYMSIRSASRGRTAGASMR